MQHFIEKWDSYLGKLFAVLVIGMALIGPQSPEVLRYFSYFVFAMIGVAAFDIVANWMQHESKFWHLAAVLSNIMMIVSCLFILQFMLSFTLPFRIPPLQIFEMQNFFLYLGIFLFIENSMWTWVYDRV
ncbi:hypothetical protein HYU11_04105 [Candidatus Woesearchaeota archaeon]|nr:hypothetical protein [Candidatus Woesearchaeota archaeon]